MGPEDPHSGPAGDGAADRAELSWQERELIAALRRVALAQSQLQTLEEAAAEAVPAVPFDHEALRELESIHAEHEYGTTTPVVPRTAKCLQSMSSALMNAPRAGYAGVDRSRPSIATRR